MSNSIDERIVEMRFDNRQFESNVQTSIKSLDNLKHGLDLQGAARGLSDLEKAGRSFSLAGIADGVDAIRNKFSALSIMGITALANITNSAINAGKRIISSLTVDPIKTGLQEYETKIGAIQTILTNTSSKGTKLEDVNKALAELNDYSDKTIYNFSEMAKNIGTFTAAGVDLKTSVSSIKGIANLAAGSGSSALQASTAMYQLSQAIASGAVKLQDWNSVVNAGMGGELFQKALEKTAKGLGHGRDMAKSFRESLESGWLTTEVLTKTLNQFANDDALIKAATQVKTFTQLIDTMKESVQSGWAVSWENIIGNKEEATVTLTAINDAFGKIIGSSADARNEMLSFWKANGGRNAIIESISNSFKGLQSILKLVHDAFIEFFPPMTGKRLVEISKGIETLTEKFKMGEETASNIKRTFRGLFAVLDIGRQAVLAIGGGLSKLLESLLPAGGGFLSVTASIGDFLVSLDKAIKRSDIFNVAIDKLGKFISMVAGWIKESVTKIKDVFESFADVDLSGVDTFSERVRIRFEPFTKLGDFIRKAFDKIVLVIEKVAPIFYKLATIIGGAFDKLRQNIINALDNADFNSIFDILNGGIFVGILLGLKKFIDSLTSISKDAGGFLKNVTGILDGVKGSLEAYQSSIKANTLLKIAIAIGILALALIGLSLIDSKKLTTAMEAMTAMFVELFGSMAIFEKIMGSAGFKSMMKVTTSMIALSIAILILSSAMTKLAKLDWEGISKGIIGIAAVSLILVQSAKSLSKGAKGLITASLGLILFALAIDVLVSAVKKLGNIDTAKLTKGLIGVGVLVTELALFMKLSDFGGFGLGKGLGIIALAAALLVLSVAVKRISEIDTGALVKGLIGVAALLTEISLFTRFTGDAKKVISTAIGLTILGAAMIIFAKAIEKMGSLSLEQIGKGLLTMGASLAIITAALKLMPKNIMGQAVGFVIIASALIILSKALSSMGKMSWAEIAKGLITLAGALTIMAVAMAFMKSGLGGAAAMIVMASALAILTPVLITLGKMPLAEIGKSLLALAGVFVIVGLAGLILAPLTPVILGLSAAIALFGLACLAVGAGILAFSAGITALSVAGTAGAAALVLFVTSVVGLIPFILLTLAKGIIEFVKVIGDSAPVIGEAFLKILNTIIDTITIATPKIINCVFTLVTSMLNTLVSAVPGMIDSGMKLILGILKGVSDNISKVVAAGIDVIVQFLNGVTSKLPAIIDTAFKVIIAFINGLADAIRANHNAIYDAVGNLISAIVQAFLDLDSSLREVGKHIVDGLIGGMRSKIYEAASWAENIAESIITSARKALGIHSPSTEFAEIGRYSVLGLVDGLSKFSGLATKEAKNVGVTAMDSLRNVVSNISDVVSGDINMNPTIRPVIDLTNVTAGANTINSLLSKNQGITVDSANIKTASITKGMQTDKIDNQNGSVKPEPLKGDATTSPRPTTIQLVLQNGKAIAEFLVDDLDNIVGNKNTITARTVGI